MKADPPNGSDGRSNPEAEVRSLYRALLDAWNGRSADAMATLFMEDASLTGFDGTSMEGREEIGAHLRQIFADHQPPAFVGLIRGVRFLPAETAILRAAAGLVPPGQSDLNPAGNMIQTVVAVKQGDMWRIALFQTTPEAFHGRPEASESLTAELRQALGASSRSGAV
jgi:uncharacterized protein (TIGR02246 family)